MSSESGLGASRISLDCSRVGPTVIVRMSRLGGFTLPEPPRPGPAGSGSEGPKIGEDGLGQFIVAGGLERSLGKEVGSRDAPPGHQSELVAPALDQRIRLLVLYRSTPGSKPAMPGAAACRLQFDPHALAGERQARQ